jgi:hypothetical protein
MLKNRILTLINSEYTNYFPSLESLKNNVAYFTEACQEFIDRNGVLDDMSESQREEYLSMLEKKSPYCDVYASAKSFMTWYRSIKKIQKEYGIRVEVKMVAYSKAFDYSQDACEYNGLTERDSAHLYFKLTEKQIKYWEIRANRHERSGQAGVKVGQKIGLCLCDNTLTIFLN